MPTTQEYKYFAFISYSSKDTNWGKRLHRKLEHYRMPATLCSERGWRRKPMNPVFFAPAEIQPGGLDDELQRRLRMSRHLIVICSPHSAKSKYVADEIRYFHSIGHPENIHFLIVDGIPHSGDPETECFNPVTEELGMPEILAANIHESIYRWPWLNRERAYVQLVTKLLGVEFDTLWQRHRRQLMRRAAAWLLGLLAVLAIVAGVWRNSQPVDVAMRVNETSVHNGQLPPLGNARVCLSLDNDTVVRMVPVGDGGVVFPNIPHRFLGEQVRVSVTCADCLPTDTVLSLSREVSLGLRRDPAPYGRVKFGLWDEKQERYVSGVTVTLDGQECVSDGDGRVEFSIPLERQQTVYHVQSSVALQSYDVNMPVGDDDCLMVK